MFSPLVYIQSQKTKSKSLLVKLKFGGSCECLYLRGFVLRFVCVCSAYISVRVYLKRFHSGKPTKYIFVSVTNPFSLAFAKPPVWQLVT